MGGLEDSKLSLTSHIFLLPEIVLLIQKFFQANENSVNFIFTENKVLLYKVSKLLEVII